MRERYGSMLLSLSALTITMLLLAACAQVKLAAVPPGEVTEAQIGTATALEKRFHSVLYYPNEIALNFPGYIVGVEKSPRETITPEGQVAFSPVYAELSAGLRHDADRLKTNRKLLFISHIMKDYGREYGAGNCALYDIYTDVNGKSLMPAQACIEGSLRGPPQMAVFSYGWKALATLRAAMEHDIDDASKRGAPYTHVFIMVMGWNTYQSEAIRNFSSIVGNAVLASNGAFRPLFIGLTWPSRWSDSALINLFSFCDKKNDADELGLSWLGALLKEVAVPLSRAKGLRVVVTGHSFGARATSMAACAGAVLARPAGTPAIGQGGAQGGAQGGGQGGNQGGRGGVDLLIGLQGAYAINRITGRWTPDGAYFPKGCDAVQHLVLTASKNDKAVSSEIFADYTGELGTYDKICADNSTRFSCGAADAKGNIGLNPLPQAARAYIDASQLITYNAFDSGGGAHSDIYRRETGELLWNLILRYAPPR